jgi:hypothetical protein
MSVALGDPNQCKTNQKRPGGFRCEFTHASSDNHKADFGTDSNDLTF